MLMRTHFMLLKKLINELNGDEQDSDLLLKWLKKILKANPKNYCLLLSTDKNIALE